METKFFIAFCSPSGSTRRVAEVIQQELTDRGADPHVLDLGKEHDWTHFLSSMSEAAQRGNFCLFIGSPVYRDQLVPPITRFIEALPKFDRGFCAPFITWGGASSGIALWQAAAGLTDKGLILAGAAKVIAQHSMMWHSPNPPGLGHPDADDEKAIQKLVQAILSRVESGNAGLSVDDLAYQPEARTAELKENLTVPKPVIPKVVDEARCIQCGTCMVECPAQTITMEPYPEMGPECFDCFNCIRLCPEGAIDPKIPLSQIEVMIRKRVETFNEKPLTQIFI